MALFCAEVHKEGKYRFAAIIHIHLFQVKNRDTRIRCEVSSKLQIKTLYVFSRFDIFILNRVLRIHFQYCPFKEKIFTKWNISTTWHAQGLSKVVKSSKTVNIN